MTHLRPHSPSRRQYLKAVGSALGVVALAGCADTSGERTAETPEGNDPTTDSTVTTDATPVHAGYETTEVRVTTAGGDVLGSVTAAVADTSNLRYLGLSDTESLPADRGMLFVYETVGHRTFVMREMDFGLDIVYADEEGVITRIHHAPAPDPNEDGTEQRYPGRGRYVLEVNYGWTTERGVEERDVLHFEL